MADPCTLNYFFGKLIVTFTILSGKRKVTTFCPMFFPFTTINLLVLFFIESGDARFIPFPYSGSNYFLSLDFLVFLYSREWYCVFFFSRILRYVLSNFLFLFWNGGCKIKVWKSEVFRWIFMAVDFWLYFVMARSGVWSLYSFQYWFCLIICSSDILLQGFGVDL